MALASSGRVSSCRVLVSLGPSWATAGWIAPGVFWASLGTVAFCFLLVACCFGVLGLLGGSFGPPGGPGEALFRKLPGQRTHPIRPTLFAFCLMRRWRPLGGSFGPPGRPGLLQGSSWAVPGAVLGRSCERLGPLLAYLGPPLASVGLSWGRLGRLWSLSRGLLGRSRLL